MLKSFYAFKRGDYWQVKLKDEHGKAMTAKSTHSKDRNEAEAIMWQWHFERNGSYYGRERIPTEPQTPVEHFTKWEQMPLIDLLLLYWDYEKSPYIVDLMQHGEPVPSEQRFNDARRVITSALKPILGDVKAGEVQTDDISKAFCLVARKRKWSGATSKNAVKFIRQALKFFYEKKYIKNDISNGLVQFKNDTKEKAIFTIEELQKIIASPEVFKNKKVYLANATCIYTGCRIGEMQALQFKDIIKDGENWGLQFSKNWLDTKKQFKTTKTGRSDIVYIPAHLAQELLKLNGVKDADAFIFVNENTTAPYRQTCLGIDLHKALRTLGIKRKGLSFHSYRYNYAVALRDKGYSADQILLLTRHASYGGLKTYLNHDSAQMQEERVEASKYIASLVT